MDFAMPDENAMELMRREFEKLHIDTAAKTLFLNSDHSPKILGGLFPTGLFLLLYFMKLLEYNVYHGIRIFDSDGSLGRLRPDLCAFRKLNNLD